MCRTIPEAMSFYVGALCFNIRFDEEVDGQRLVIASPPNLTEFAPLCSLRFIEAKGQRDKAAVGNQGGDQTFLQVETDDWDAVYEKLKAMGTRILDKEPRKKGDYRAVTVLDPFGNRVNLIEKTTTTLGKMFTADVGLS